MIVVLTLCLHFPVVTETQSQEYLFLYAVVGLAVSLFASAIVNFVFNRFELGEKYEKSNIQ